MKDIYNTTILCEKCNRKTKKKTIHKEGFTLRAWECPKCNKLWYHPLDQQEYQNFQKLRDKNFRVKLRLVGNSFCVSIPKEIIEFHREMQKEMNEMISMSLEEPEKLSLYFTKRFKRLI